MIKSCLRFGARAVWQLIANECDSGKNSNCPPTALQLVIFGFDWLSHTNKLQRDGSQHKQSTLNLLVNSWAVCGNTANIHLDTKCYITWSIWGSRDVSLFVTLWYATEDWSNMILGECILVFILLCMTVLVQITPYVTELSSGLPLRTWQKIKNTPELTKTGRPNGSEHRGEGKRLGISSWKYRDGNRTWSKDWRLPPQS